MYYVYALKSLATQKRYIGSTADPKERFASQSSLYPQAHVSRGKRNVYCAIGVVN